MSYRTPPIGNCGSTLIICLGFFYLADLHFEEIELTDCFLELRVMV